MNTDLATAEPIAAAVRYVAARCDGAVEQDGRGFDGTDTHFGKGLALIPVEQWSPEQTYAGWELTRKYRRQLEAGGFDVDAIAEPPLPDLLWPSDAKDIARAQVRVDARELVLAESMKVSLDAGRLLVEFDYDQSLVALVRDLKGARFDRDRTAWRVPPSPLVANALSNWHWTDGAREACAAVADEPGPSVRIRIAKAGETWEVRFDYEADLVASIKRIPGARFARTDGDPRWIIRELGAPELAAWAAANGAEGDLDDLAPVAELTATKAELSRTLDHELTVPGLRGEPWAFQRGGIAYASLARRCFLADEMGLGKLQPVSEPVLTPCGWRPIGDLAVGDEVIGSDGCPTIVLGVFPQEDRRVVRVECNDGSWTRCGPDHLWSTRRSANRPWRVRTTSEIMTTLRDGAGNLAHFIPVVAPVEHPVRVLPIEPYLFGVLLGDGSITRTGQVSICTDDAILDVLDLPMTRSSHDSPDVGYGASPALKVPLVALGLAGKQSWEKHVPVEYLHASIEQRRALLAGLLDTDGSARSDTIVEYCSTSEALVDGVRELVESLGGIARKSGPRITQYPSHGEKLDGRPSWRVNVKLTENPFRLERKAAAWRATSKYPPARAIRSVTPEPAEDSVCIRVTAPDQLYVTRHHIVTHNTIQALGTIQMTGAYPALVAGPAKMRTKWGITALEWLPEGTRVAVVLPASTPKLEINRVAARGLIPMLGQPTPGAADVYIHGTLTLHEAVDAYKACRLEALVIDESQSVKTRDRTKLCPLCEGPTVKGGACKAGHRYTGRPISAYKVLSTRAAKTLSDEMRARCADPVILLASGTPNSNTTSDFVAQLDIMGRLEDFGGEWKFLVRYCNAHQDGWGRWVTTGSSNLTELNERLRSLCYVRRAKAEVMPDLPPIVRSPEVLELNGALGEYRKAEADYVKFLELRAAALAKELGEDPRSAAVMARLKAEAGAHLVEMTTLKRQAAIAKIPVAQEWVSEFLASDPERKLIIFAHHLDVLDAIESAFGCPRIDGSTGDAAAIEERFQTDPACRLVAVGIKAGGVGLTLTAAHDELFIEMVWTSTDHDQAEARAYGRVNDAHGVQATYLLAAGTVDEHNWKLLEGKRATFHAAADGAAREDDAANAGEVLESLLAASR